MSLHPIFIFVFFHFYFFLLFKLFILPVFTVLSIQLTDENFELLLVLAQESNWAMAAKDGQSMNQYQYLVISKVIYSESYLAIYSEVEKYKKRRLFFILNLFISCFYFIMFVFSTSYSLNIFCPFISLKFKINFTIFSDEWLIINLFKIIVVILKYFMWTHHSWQINP